MISFYRSQNPQENVVIEAAFEGCPVEKRITNFDNYEPSEVAVVMGVYKKRVPISFQRGLVIRQQQSKGLDCLILETGYINRGAGPDNHYAFGWNGLNGRADFRNKGMPADRAEKLRVKLRSWRETGSYFLLCGQVPWDASVDFTDHVKWLHAMSCKLLEGKRRVIFRPHPLAKIPPIDGCDYSSRTIEEDLEDAFCSVSFNSNSGVDSILAGVPAFSYDVGSMIHPVSAHDFRFDHPLRCDRAQWLYDIAYAQWLPSELRSGEAWEHIFRKKTTAG